MDEHTVKSYDKELAELNALVLRMGGLVQEQITAAVDSLRNEDIDTARNVIARDHMVNFIDVQADEQIVNLLARRQPMGRDLRMVISLSKSVSDIERIGDEAEAIARMAIHMYGGDAPSPSRKLIRDAGPMSSSAIRMVGDALDSLARLDVDLALEVSKADRELDADFQSALRRLATFVMEDSRNVGHTINVTFVLKALERIGDHAKNIAEYVVFLVKGKDVRHISPESIEREVLDEAD